MSNDKELKKNEIVEIRGGSWDDNPDDLRAAFHGWGYPDPCDYNLGFRVVHVPKKKVQANEQR